MPTNRRLPAAVSAVLIAALAFTGCTPQNSEPADTASTSENDTSDSLVSAPESTTDYPLTLETQWGDTVLEERPERISIAGVGSEVELLALLDSAPVGVASQVLGEDGIRPWVAGLLPASVEHTWEWSREKPISVESVAASDPDLIIADSSLSEETFSQLRSIAPVLHIHNQDDDWQTQITQIGEAIDLSGKAEDVISEDEAFWEGFRATHPEFESVTVTFAVGFGNQGDQGTMILNGPGMVGESFFTRMGFAPNPGLTELVGVNPISDELLPMLDADVVIAMGSFTDKFSDQPLFQSLSAVQDDHFIVASTASGENENFFNGESIGFNGHFGHILGGMTGPVGERLAAEAIAPPISQILQ